MPWSEMATKWNGIEWNGTQCNGMERNGMEWNGTEWNRLLKIDARSSQIGAPGPPESAPEAARGGQSRFRDHFEQQVELPWPIWAAIWTL